MSQFKNTLAFEWCLVRWTLERFHFNVSKKDKKKNTKNKIRTKKGIKKMKRKTLSRIQLQTSMEGPKANNNFPFFSSLTSQCLISFHQYQDVIDFFACLLLKLLFSRSTAWVKRMLYPVNCVSQSQFESQRSKKWLFKLKPICHQTLCTIYLKRAFI